jgi:alpha-beta hydrolase superfamily lysophospholipase
MFVLGHSMGGLIAAQFALRYQDQMRGLVTSGAALLPGEDVPPLAVRAGKLLARIAPKMTLVALEATAVSRDPDVVAHYESDPLNYRGKIRAGIGGSMFINGEAVLKQAHTLTLPMLVMHGEADRLIPAQASRLLYERAGSEDKTLKIYPELYHEIFNEPEKAQVLADLVAWLDAH